MILTLTKGYQCIIDDADYEIVKNFTWYANNHGRLVYARTTIEGVKVKMHNLIMCPPEGIYVDHIDNNTLNNQRINLRFASKSENQCNRKKPANNTTGHKNIVWNKLREKYAVQITKNGVMHNCGLFINLDEALKVRNDMLIKLHGNFANKGD